MPLIACRNCQVFSQVDSDPNVDRLRCPNCRSTDTALLGVEANANSSYYYEYEYQDSAGNPMRGRFQPPEPNSVFDVPPPIIVTTPMPPDQPYPYIVVTPQNTTGQPPIFIPNVYIEPPHPQTGVVVPPGLPLNAIPDIWLNPDFYEPSLVDTPADPIGRLADPMALDPNPIGRLPDLGPEHWMWPPISTQEQESNNTRTQEIVRDVIASIRQLASRRLGEHDPSSDTQILDRVRLESIRRFRELGYDASNIQVARDPSDPSQLNVTGIIMAITPRQMSIHFRLDEDDFVYHTIGDIVDDTLDDLLFYPVVVTIPKDPNSNRQREVKNIFNAQNEADCLRETEVEEICYDGGEVDDTFEDLLL